MATVQITCPKCTGIGLIPPPPMVVCPECGGVGLITVSDQSTLATINAASQAPIEVTAPDDTTIQTDDAVVQIENQQ